MERRGAIYQADPLARDSDGNIRYTMAKEGAETIKRSTLGTRTTALAMICTDLAHSLQRSVSKKFGTTELQGHNYYTPTQSTPKSNNTPRTSLAA